MEMDNYKININNLIALCHIIDDFEEFKNRLSSVINRDFIFQLWDVSKGTFILEAHKAKKFYAENKSVIDKINKYSTVPAFLNLDFWMCENEKNNLQFFYQYILEHKSEMNKILAVLGKIKELGFTKIEFNSELDFTQETHKVCTSLFDNSDIIYLDNLTAIPDYNPGTLSYKTVGSKYKIKIGTFLFMSKEIVLNDLTFDSNELPSVLSKEELFSKIISLKEEKQQEYTAIKDSIYLSVGISDLYNMCNTISSTINNLENIEKKEDLVQLLQIIKEAIFKMQTISTEYNHKIIESNPSISQEFLDEQKKTYIRLKKNS